jgi:hypothetical protein
MGTPSEHNTDPERIDKCALTTVTRLLLKFNVLASVLAIAIDVYILLPHKCPTYLGGGVPFDIAPTFATISITPAVLLGALTLVVLRPPTRWRPTSTAVALTSGVISFTILVLMLVVMVPAALSYITDPTGGCATLF